MYLALGSAFYWGQLGLNPMNASRCEPRAALILGLQINLNTTSNAAPFHLVSWYTGWHGKSPSPASFIRKG